ncbi:hypothetical protein [Clostridium botulinum]|uniref:hypothetical protein n=1 Tax=Clostridium botulinum TaxID=1491 RepID=UPI00174BDBE2|nr:hypothetical protein [Clostridium botulinum]MBD5589223.1 hypothetical protein [Clostridium botulinum]
MRYYLCFSWRLKNFLRNKKIFYKYKDKHTKSGCVFYVYKKTDALDKALKEYSKLKKEWRTKIDISF